MPATEVTVRVPGKVNLQLSVGPRREDGFHDIATVFHAVALHDDVTVAVAPIGSGISLTCEGEGQGDVPLDSTNLAWQAVQLLADSVGIQANVQIRIHKHIPVAGGMAGGSADAAGALLASDALWNLGTPKNVLHDLAAAIGSDVPFALHGGTAIGSGRGERITPVLASGTFHWVFALAPEGLSTAAVYAECDRLREGRHVPDPYMSDMMMQALRAGDPVLLGKSLHNDLQQAAFSLRPILGRVLEAGEEAGALGGIVSGSGPTCAFLARDAEHALDIAVHLTSSGIVRSVKRSSGPAPGARII
ncbi:MAG: 4-(cytidine 5'-diphospho)-2-C-methyl-D-erythritol kinase [Actinobacteria bacterium]|uniref:4-(cytidine 5'-diphospho)-2-C-methyl-D-erythritol kinase n=1 Tax=freshwater metagenome TaxID=449393 RepID=A0A6J7GIX5_9ZZZZ|nr:4-(cytidine 5'-diphospho)-2-C-methyl-D-erythritol kinase [Actinomycetota bacterium]MTB27798.1 4-(cytidine 5'-diphospho)-2-C-methyl-D-erythritol kinase [Actinomycetota bacterium]